MEENTFEGAIEKITPYTASTKKGPAKAFRLQVNGDEFSGWGESAVNDRYLVEGDVVRGRFEVNRGFKNIIEDTLVLVKPASVPGEQTDLTTGPKPGAHQSPTGEGESQTSSLPSELELRVRCEGLQAAACVFDGQAGGLDSPQPVLDYAVEFEKHLRGRPRA